MAKSPRKHSLIPTPFELFEQGIAYGNTGRHDKAITAFDEVIRRYGRSSRLAMREIVARALINKGIILNQAKYPDEAIAAYDEVIRRYSGDTDPVYKKIVLQAICNAAEVLKRQGRKEEAEKRRRMIEELFGSEAAKAYDDFNGA